MPRCVCASTPGECDLHPGTTDGQPGGRAAEGGAPRRRGRAARVCLNMIVKNEAENLPRLLRSVRDHIDCWAIVDTGSADDTRDVILRELRGIPGEMGSCPFVDFGQARNYALRFAMGSELKFDYLLLADADMELVVHETDFREHLTHGAYHVVQRSGGLAYANVRLARRDENLEYRGVTHEYIDVPGGPGALGSLHSVSFADHASGSNRANKAARDIMLLKAGLEAEPDNGRYYFYLGQSLRDDGRLEEAVDAFRQRIRMGGWEEETFMAALNEARCLRRLGRLPEACAAAVAAYGVRPQRAESLFELASIHNEAGNHPAAFMYALEGMNVPFPHSDVLFLETWVYSEAIRQELYVAAGHLRESSPARFDLGFQVCEEFALGRGWSDAVRGLARYNLAFFAPLLHEVAPSLKAGRVGLAVPAGFTATNPSVAWHGNRLFLYQRTVNYRIREDGSYEIPEADAGVVRTRNFLVELDRDLQPVAYAEVLPPASMPAPQGERLFEGLEDGRLCSDGANLWVSSTACELTPEKWRQILLAKIPVPDLLVGDPVEMGGWAVLQPGPGPEIGPPARHEKNWMPFCQDGELRFFYSVDPAIVVSGGARTLHGSPQPLLALDHLRGGGQAVPFDGGWLAITHEVIEVSGRRRYLHRFLLMDETGAALRVSRPFHLQRQGAIEFACGLAWGAAPPGGPSFAYSSGDAGAELILGFGVEDAESWMGKISAADVRKMLRGADSKR